MDDWDDDSPRLVENLTRVLRGIRDAALRRELPTLESARQWQRDSMTGLKAPHPDFVGGFRGEPGILERCEVEIGGIDGVKAARVATESRAFEKRVHNVLQALDAAYPPGSPLDADGLDAVLEFAAWAQAQWVRIHPFANGNGRTARLWANGLLMRYDVPPFLRLWPRPNGAYARAGARAMEGDWAPTSALFRALLNEYLGTGTG